MYIFSDFSKFVRTYDIESGSASVSPVASTSSSSSSEEEDVVVDLLKNKEYFTRFDTVFDVHEAGLRDCYTKFRLHSIDGLKGFEYLRDKATPTIDGVQFPMLRLDTMKSNETYIHVTGTIDTFMVCRVFDYIYSYIIEEALLPEPSVNLKNQMKYYRKMRMATMKICTDRHLYKMKCPYEWVVYTRKTSEFYTYCQDVLRKNPYVTYNESFLNIMPISFYLANFLCPLENSNDHNQWVRVPLLFIDLWQLRAVLV